MMFKRLFFVLGCILFLGVFDMLVWPTEKSLADLRKGSFLKNRNLENPQKGRSTFYCMKGLS